MTYNNNNLNEIHTDAFFKKKKEIINYNSKYKESSKKFLNIIKSIKKL